MKIPNLRKVTNYTIIGVLSVLGILLVISATQKNSSKRCKGIEIKIKDNANQLLITKNDVEKWITNYGNEPFEGKIIENIDLSSVEKRVLNKGLAKKCEAFTNLQGYLVVDIEGFTPIARILGENGFPDWFLDKEGTIFPFSRHFSPNVTLLSGSYFNNLKSLKTKNNQDILSLIVKISNDEFWEAQIAQINVDNKKEIQMIPLMGNNTIEFGRPEHIDGKLNKLLIFYKQILPQKQWEAFSKISVKYDGQIVCN